MDISEIFRMNLLQLMRDRKISAYSLSRKAGLNNRAVKDIEERRAMSPRIVTVFKLAEALEVPPQDLLGLKKCSCSVEVDPGVDVHFFSSLRADQRELLLVALRQLVDAVNAEPPAATSIHPSGIPSRMSSDAPVE